MDNYFKEKVVLITGGASGIGKATCLKFSEQGSKVVIVDMNEVSGKELEKQISDKGGEAVFVSCDLTIEEEIKSAIEVAIKRFNRLDFAYNNAGYGGKSGNIENYPVDDWDKVMNINLKAVFLCMKYEIPHILKQGGAIVNCASVLSEVVNEDDSAYVASKFGVLGLTKNAALEYAKKGIRINEVSPGFTRTPMIEYAGETKLDAIAARHPIGRLAKPEEIAEAVLWLCSEKASYLIGTNLMVDGGYTLI